MNIIHLCPTKIKLTSLGMYTTREKDYCAGFDFVIKDGNKLKNIINLPAQERKNETSYIKIFQHKMGVAEQN